MTKDNKYLPLIDNTDWRGYTLDELRHHRAMTLIRIEIEKERIVSGAHELYVSKIGPLSSLRHHGIIANGLSVLSFIDYAVIGVRLIRKISAIYKTYRQK